MDYSAVDCGKVRTIQPNVKTAEVGAVAGALRTKKGHPAQGIGIREHYIHRENWGTGDILPGKREGGVAPLESRHWCRMAGDRVGRESRSEMPPQSLAGDGSRAVSGHIEAFGFYTKHNRRLSKDFKHESNMYGLQRSSWLSIGRERKWRGLEVGRCEEALAWGMLEVCIMVVAKGWWSGHIWVT